MNSAAEWIAQIPDQVTPRQAIGYIDQALADATEATRNVRARFTGTLPPPPWPQSEELAKTIAALEGGKVFLSKMVDIGRGDDLLAKTSPNGIALMNGGRQLYAEIARMQKTAAELPTAADAPELIAEMAKKAAATRWGGLAILLGVVWLANHFEDDA